LTLPPKSANRPGPISSNTAPLRRQGDAAIVVFFVEYSFGGFVALTFEAFLAEHAASSNAAARAWRCPIVAHFTYNRAPHFTCTSMNQSVEGGVVDSSRLCAGPHLEICSKDAVK